MTGKGPVDPEKWPSVGYEPYKWAPSDDLPMSRRQRSEQTGTYWAAVTPEIAGVRSLPLKPSTVSMADEASAEIARFDAELGQTVAPFTSLLLRSESASSSKIEHLSASAKAIALAELGDTSRNNAGIIVANTRAMEAAVALADQLDARSILKMHDVRLAGTHPEWAGRWRGRQVWIGGSNHGPISAAFVPPHHRRVPAAIDDLIEFLRRDDFPALIQATITHAQFETIHPFPDGNGRTGRALLHATLRAKRLTRTVTVPISAGLLADTARYFDALTAYRQGDLDALITMMVDAAFLAVGNGRRLVTELTEIRASWNERIRTRKGSTAWKLADLLIRQPVVDSSLVQNELGAAATNVNSAIDHLVEVQVLHKVSGNYRNRKWAATEVLDALDAFAVRAGRRGK